MPNIIQFGGGGGGAKIGVTLNEDGTQNVLLSDNGTVLDLAAGTADATATNEDVLDGKTFYAGGVKKTGSFVVAPDKVLLWENPNPAATVFEGKSIPVEGTNFTHYIIECKFENGVPSTLDWPTTYTVINKYGEAVTGQLGGACIANSFAKGYFPAMRYITAANDTTVTFSYGLYNSSTSNNRCIPIRIYGTNNFDLNT